MIEAPLVFHHKASILFRLGPSGTYLILLSLIYSPAALQMDVQDLSMKDFDPLAV
ncbi:hypothetical protein BABINDRAFT_71755 [Babjeviella inositovora NRRL Y-12698]|uniref:Uncharacterized protein n=1 Tax=Babjeviella inositovora NRRL Y-12698 TaxID=984486 RepID=A0A1E3QXM3_9ASCO|nr:uncharacterized protein BABINDRAFT_71755 [Babjeviella inositovora NRRL Y-12698]ODQ82413.1 hypothetical protein BABINDRAFT_71755 [Babjeviella inositovora NRRL Y-12698]